MSQQRSLARLWQSHTPHHDKVTSPVVAYKAQPISTDSVYSDRAMSGCNDLALWVLPCPICASRCLLTTHRIRLITRVSHFVLASNPQNDSHTAQRARIPNYGGTHPCVCQLVSEQSTQPTNRLLKMSVHSIDDSALRIFSLCLPVLLDSDENNCTRVLKGGGWRGEHW